MNDERDVIRTARCPRAAAPGLALNDALIVAIRALELLAATPGCGCGFPCRCGGSEWTRAELEGRMDVAAEALAEITRIKKEAR